MPKNLSLPSPRIGPISFSRFSRGDTWGIWGSFLGGGAGEGLVGACARGSVSRRFQTKWSHEHQRVTGGTAAVQPPGRDDAHRNGIAYPIAPARGEEPLHDRRVFSSVALSCLEEARMEFIGRNERWTWAEKRDESKRESTW